MTYVVNPQTEIAKVYIKELGLIVLASIIMFFWIIINIILKLRKKPVEEKSDMQLVNKDYKSKFIKKAMFYFPFVMSVLLAIVWVFCIPLIKDIPYAKNKEYYEADVVVLKHYNPGVRTHGALSVRVQTLDGESEFYFSLFHIATELQEGQIIHIQILPNSKYGGYAIYDE